MRHARRMLLLLGLVAGTIGCDRVTKRLAVTELSGLPRQSYLADTVRLEYTENTGAFLGLGAGLPFWARAGAFSVGTGILLAGIAVVIVRGRHSGPTLLALCLIWAGGVSNLVDRVAQGAVIDFLNVGLGPVRTGIFNVADVAIMAGLAILAAARPISDAAVTLSRSRTRKRT